jgi:hypothetical protein
MKIKTGALVGMLSGAMGNLVASRNRYGPYLRTRVVPALRTTEWTVAIRGRLAGLAQAWAGLTEDQKVAWETWANEHPVVDRLGDSQVLHGEAVFIQLNMRVLALGGTQIDVPPVAVPPDPVSGLTLTVESAAGVVTLAWTSGALAAGAHLVIWAAVVNSAGQRYYKNKLKLVHYSAAAATSPEDFKDDLIERFGTLAVGQIVYVHAFVYDSATGLSSSVAMASDEVEAPA